MYASGLVTIGEIEAAARVLEPVIRRTPVDRPAFLEEMTGRPVLLKHEQLQRTGSFKIRGAYHRIAHLTAEERDAGVVTASAGNHGQGVALAAALNGVRATIFMPDTAALPKVEATRNYGADVVLVDGQVHEALAAAEERSERTGARFVPPFDDPFVIAGQGTLGLELDEQAPGAQTFVVAVGGGGLVSGVATALKSRRGDVRVIGVEAEGATPMIQARAAGKPVEVESVQTIADGIAVRRVSELTLAHVTASVDDLVTVSDAEISRAMLLLLERGKTLVEPAGAATLAAILSGRVGGDDAPVAAVLSGGNVDPTLLSRLIVHGLSAAGRYLLVHVRLLDRPGELMRMLGVLGALDLNVIDVEHHRAGEQLDVDEVDVRLVLETRDPDHRQAALDALTAAGYTVDT